MTGSNKKLIDAQEYEKMVKEKVNLSDYFKFQNAYILIYLNAFFYNASSEFQEAFSSPDIQLPKNFWDLIEFG